MSGIGLTPKMRDLLAVLSRNPNASQLEMRTALGITGYGSVAERLTALEQRGYIRRLRKRARAIEIIRPLPINIKGQRYRFIPVAHHPCPVGGEGWT